MGDPVSAVVRIGEHELDLHTRQLRHAGEPVALEPKAFSLLAILAENADRLVTKSELLDRVWPDVFVAEASLTSSVRKVRSALGADASRIVTVHRRGYRLCTDASVVAPGPEPTAEVEGTTAPGSTIFGRDEEIARLLAASRESRAGSGRLWIVRGPGGIGKTHLVAEVVRRLRSEHLHLRANCRQLGESPPFYPWVQILRAYTAAAGAEVSAPVLASYADDLALIVPELFPGQDPGEARSPVVDAAQDLYRLLDAVASTLRRAAASGPLLITIEDIHEADEASLNLLELVAREITTAPIFLLATYRSPAEFSDYFENSLARLVLEPNVRALTLGPLDEDTAAQLVRSLAHDEQPATAIRDMYAISEGIPLYLTLLARRDEVVDVRAPSTTTGSLPASLHAMVEERLRSLPEASMQALERAAVLGREFDVRALAHMEAAGMATAVESVLEALRPVAVAGIIASGGASTYGYRFAHSLFRDGVYERIRPSERARLHLRAGEAIAALGATSDDERLAEIAWHFGRGASAGGAERAVRYHLRAGQNASAQLSYEFAAQHFREAIECQKLCEARDVEQQAQLWIHLAEAEARRGRLAPARDAAETAAEIARRLGSPKLLGMAALAPGRPLSARGEVDPSFVRLLQEAIAAQPPAATVLGARLRSRLAWAYYYAQDRGRSRMAMSADAVALARELDDPETLLWALFERHIALTCPEHGSERLQVAQELVDRAREAGNLEFVALGYEARAWDLAAVGRMKEAMRAIDEFGAIAEQLRLPYFRWIHLSWQSMHAAQRGDFDELRTRIAGASQIGGQIDAPLAALAAAATNIFIDVACGRFDAAESVLRLMASRFPSLPTLTAVLAYVLAERGDLDAARLECDALGPEDLDGLPWDTTWMAAVAFLAVAEARTGRREHCRVLYERLAPYAEQVILFGLHASMSVGPVALPLAILATVLGELDRAEAHFEAAVALDRQMGADTWLAYALIEYAEMLKSRKRRGDAGRARQLRDEARQLAERIGLENVQARAGAIS